MTQQGARQRAPDRTVAPRRHRHPCSRATFERVAVAFLGVVRDLLRGCFERTMLSSNRGRINDFHTHFAARSANAFLAAAF